MGGQSLIPRVKWQACLLRDISLCSKFVMGEKLIARVRAEQIQFKLELQLGNIQIELVLLNLIFPFLFQKTGIFSTLLPLCLGHEVGLDESYLFQMLCAYHVGCGMRNLSFLYRF